MLAGFEFRLTPPSPWLSVANKQMDLTVEAEPLKIQFVSWVQGENGGWEERPMGLGNRDLKAV